MSCGNRRPVPIIPVDPKMLPECHAALELALHSDSGRMGAARDRPKSGAKVSTASSVSVERMLATLSSCIFVRERRAAMVKSFPGNDRRGSTGTRTNKLRRISDT